MVCLNNPGPNWRIARACWSVMSDPFTCAYARTAGTEPTKVKVRVGLSIKCSPRSPWHRADARWRSLISSAKTAASFHKVVLKNCDGTQLLKSFERQLQFPGRAVQPGVKVL